MSILDCLIVVIPIAILLYLAFYSRKYARSAVDFLAAGRVAGRYVMSVGDMMSALSVILLVAYVEQNYQTGFAVAFWNIIIAPVSMFIALSGFIVYRWREAKFLSFGHFLELRYGSKFFRMFCAFIRTITEMIVNAMGPAIAANFFIYYLGLPHSITLFGVSLPTYIILVGLCLFLAVLFILPSGRISLLITDSVQGILTFPIFLLILFYLLYNFSWSTDIMVTLENRVPGESFFNPYDISKLRDFNFFAVIVLLLGQILNRGVWMGNDTAAAGKNPHEQKMAGILGAWRNGLSQFLMLALAMITITFMNNIKFSEKSNSFNLTNYEIRQELSYQVIDAVIENPKEQLDAKNVIKNIPISSTERLLSPLSQKDNLDTIYVDAVKQSLGDDSKANFQTQKFKTLYQQMMMPVLLKNIFPVGLFGVFCLLMVMLLISTDDSRIYNSATTIVQDLILPLAKKRVNPETHIRIIRYTTVCVALFFLIVSIFFVNLDYINMFLTILVAIWSGGAGPVVLFGLYSRWGNLVGAWSAFIFGSGISLLGAVGQRTWALHIYPYLVREGLVDKVDNILKSISKPFNPWIVWEINPEKFPINSYEIMLISMLAGVLMYIVGSLLFYKPFNLDKFLNRGIYSENNVNVSKEKFFLRGIFAKMIGITPEYTKSDKVIAYAVFGYSFVYSVILAFLLVVIWNCFYEWPEKWWKTYFFITMIIVPAIISVVSTVWFLWGGIKDCKKLFIDLAERKNNDDDNGQLL